MQHNSQESLFQSGQIVCLESGNNFLYGEVVQVIVERQLCWVRPLTIAIRSNEDSYHFDGDTEQEIIDLRSASDLLLPVTLFRASYDTEVISILAELADKEEYADDRAMSLSLNKFVKQVWQDNQDKFTNSQP